MQVLLTGHAGLLISSGSTSVLCDPWFDPAYLGSWYPFPDNAGVDADRLRSPSYLYISHLHRDHFDPDFLARGVDKKTTVLLPEFPLGELRAALEGLGFTRFVQTADGVPVELDGIRAAIRVAASPSDGPMGDSVLAVDDGTCRLLDQNDCHPRDPAALGVLGPYDLHLLQYSGAIWYPMVYRMDAAAKAREARSKRERQVARALGYIRSVGAAHVVPFAGPPAFLDPELFGLNDLTGDPESIFPDQVEFLREMAAAGVGNGLLAYSGSEITLTPGRVEVDHAVEPEEIWPDKEAYLLDYQERRKAQTEAGRPEPALAAGRDGDELAAALAAWGEPLLAGAPTLRRALGGRLVLDAGAYGVVLDPGEGTLRRWRGESWEHWFGFAPEVLWSLVERHVTDWVNDTLLSCRFEADRVGGYNEAVFSFLKCLEPERMAFLEQTLAAAEREAERGGESDAEGGEGCGAGGGAGREDTFVCGEWIVQRRCPHLGADLSRFGELHGHVLTCALHGRRFDLRTGACLNGREPPLRTRRAPQQTEEQCRDRPGRTETGGLP